MSSTARHALTSARSLVSYVKMLGRQLRQAERERDALKRELAELKRARLCPSAWRFCASCDAGGKRHSPADSSSTPSL